MTRRPVTAGNLDARVTFAKRAEVDDGFGNVTGDFVDQFTLWAKVAPLRGGETVMAARLEGTQPVVISVRFSDQARAIAPDWRATIDGVAYAITSPPADMTGDRAFLDMIATTGEAP